MSRRTRGLLGLTSAAPQRGEPKTDRIIRPHDARHTTATLLLGQRVHPNLVSEMLGHATTAIILDALLRDPVGVTVGVTVGVNTPIPMVEFVFNVVVPRKGLDGADCTVVHGDAPEYEVATR